MLLHSVKSGFRKISQPPDQTSVVTASVKKVLLKAGFLFHVKTIAFKK